MDRQAAREAALELDLIHVSFTSLEHSAGSSPSGVALPSGPQTAAHYLGAPVLRQHPGQVGRFHPER